MNQIGWACTIAAVLAGAAGAFLLAGNHPFMYGVILFALCGSLLGYAFKAGRRK